jgi:dephospho-CoA kinase
LGAATLSTDAVVHDLYVEPEVVRAVVRRWGPEMERDGAVDRAAVAQRAFAAEEERTWLEGLLWPRVGARVATWRTAIEAREPAPAAAVVEVPLLFEAGMDALFDATIAVVAPEELRARRAGARGHAALDERHARQLPQHEKARRATYAVPNDGSVDDLERQLSALLVKLRA